MLPINPLTISLHPSWFPVANGGDDKRHLTDITIFRLNWLRGQISEKRFSFSRNNMLCWETFIVLLLLLHLYTPVQTPISLSFSSPSPRLSSSPSPYPSCPYPNTSLPLSLSCSCSPSRSPSPSLAPAPAPTPSHTLYSRMVSCNLTYGHQKDRNKTNIIMDFLPKHR